MKNNLSHAARAAAGSAVAVILLSSPGVVAQSAPDRRAALADELLATDRRFADDAAKLNVIDALTAMFREDVTMVAPQGFVAGPAEARKVLLTNPANATSRAEWTPFRAGISADGTHGFTVGFFRSRLADGSVRPGKYIAYWIKDASGWKVAAYKRAPAAAGDTPAEMMPPSLPVALVALTTDASTIEAHRVSLQQAEKAFSDEAQVIGVGPAFQKWGRDDATNMGDPQKPTFTVGAQAIGAGNGQPGSAKIEWSADRALVASSGDLGITFGHIRAKDGSRPPSAFFTIWRRDGPSAPWRYIAE